MVRASLKTAALLLAILASYTAWAVSGIYIEDDFTGEERYFYQGTLGDSTYTYHADEGFYEINALKSGSGALAIISDPFSHYEVRTRVEFYDSAPRATTYAGIVFHYTEDERGRASFYIFAIFADGYLGVWRMDHEAKRSYVLPLKQTDLVSPAGSNRLRVRAEGSRFYLYLNDMFAGEFQDRALNEGGVGLYASRGSTVRFRRFQWRVAEDPASGQVPANGPFGWLPSRRYEALFQDDFSEKLWREGASGTARFKYTDSGYEINNSQGNTMTLSYRLTPIAHEGILLALFRRVEGDQRNGFGLGLSFRTAADLPSYYAFVIARDGTFKLFKTKDGRSEVLLPWRELPFELDVERPVMLAAGFLREGQGLRIIVGVNGRPVASWLDEEPLQPGGFALLAAPLVRATVAGVTLLSLKDNQDALRSKLDAWMNAQSTPEEDGTDAEAN